MKSTLGCQVYPWSQIYARQNKRVEEHLDEVLETVKRCGASAWEPFLPGSVTAARALGEQVKRHGLSMPSVYANVRLLEADWVNRVEATLEAARWVKEAGARILVVNPEPISWGQPLDKDDAQLASQASAMQALGVGLNAQGQRLAYHIHAPEMRRNARELNHTLDNTKPQTVGLCLDSHWIYRGAGDSQAALDSVVEKHHARIVSLHLRQSRGGTWSEFFGPGDLSHERLVRTLQAMDFAGPLVLEQAIEDKTPVTMEPEAAFKKSVQYARALFGLGAA